MEKLESKRKKNYEDLQNLLSMRLNQFKMLSNTLCEMVSKEMSIDSIEALKSEIDASAKEIELIRKDLDLLDEDKNVSYNYYSRPIDENINDERLKSSGFYDSIVKQTNAAKFSEQTNKRNYKEEEHCDKFQAELDYEKSETKDVMNELFATVDDRILSNRFLVDVKDSLFIPEVMINSVAFDLKNKTVSICIYDFVANVDGNKFPIMEVLKYATNEFNFNIKHLTANSKTSYVENYSKCHIVGIYKDPIDYNGSDFSKIQILIKYENVEYEASN